jgi:hypothetical protein
MPKFRAILAIFILAGITAVAAAQVNQDELKQDLPQVIFINYEGPHARIDTREQIRQRGVVLGRQISAGEGVMASRLDAMTFEQRRSYTYKIEAGASSRYYIIHCVSGPEDNKIDADIFGLGVDTGVDHIRNLRTIIQGYLQDAYGYTPIDAALLAQYITIYNAVYRGNWDYFNNRFKSQVIGNLVKERAGLSIRYDEWPGRTMMLIPLGIGGISAIDTTTITDSRVIEELRREDDRGIQQRQDMVDLKEREAEQAEQRAQTERENIRQEERQVAQERQDIAQERQQVQEDQDAGRITPEEAAQAQEQLDQREQAADEKDQELDQRREDVQQLEQFAEQKTDEAQQERQQIAADQQEAIAAGTTASGIFGIAITRTDPTTMGRIIRVSLTGAEQRRSPLETVHVRTVTFIGGKLLAIAGENVGNGAVRLIELDQNNLEMAKQGDDDMQTGSLIWVNGNDLYAITLDHVTGKCSLGRFNTDLAIQAKSAVNVHPSASVTIQQGRLLTQREDGSALMLNPADLTESK